MFFQFDDFVIDTDRRELKGAVGIIHVEPQVFDLLAHFVQNANRVISKDELIEGIWKGRAISDAALNSRITSARRAIGDSGRNRPLFARSSDGAFCLPQRSRQVIGWRSPQVRIQRMCLSQTDPQSQYCLSKI